MTAVSIGDSLGEGFGLIRRRPVSMLIWGLIQGVVAAGGFALLAPFYLQMIQAAQSAGRTGGAPPDLGLALQMQGVSWLVNFANLTVSVVVNCAVFRAILRPDDRRWAYLRIGPAELFLGLTAIVASVAAVICIFALVIPLAIVVGIATAAHAMVLAVIIGAVTFIAAMVGLTYLALRFSMVGPQTVDKNRFVFFETWPLTRGHAGSLFLLGLCLFVILLLAEMVLGLVLLAVGAGYLGAAAGGLGNLQAFFKQPPATIIGGMAPLLAVFALVWIPFSGGALAFFGGAWARAYRDLTGPDLAATFS